MSTPRRTQYGGKGYYAVPAEVVVITASDQRSVHVGAIAALHFPLAPALSLRRHIPSSRASQVLQVKVVQHVQVLVDDGQQRVGVRAAHTGPGPRP